MLTLPIKGKWYCMIQSGEKLEEYRADTPYYAARFARHEGQTIHLLLRNGYRADSPTLEAVVIPRRRAGAKPEWGGNPAETCWVLEITDIIQGENGGLVAQLRAEDNADIRGGVNEPGSPHH